MEVGPDVPAELPKGSEVPLVVSKGPAPRADPHRPGGQDLRGGQGRPRGRCSSRPRRSTSSATTWRRARSSASAPARAPRRATARSRCVVSKGPDLVEVPSVQGKSLDEAVAALEAAGLVVGDAFGPAKGQPFATEPAGGHQGQARRHGRHLPEQVATTYSAPDGVTRGSGRDHHRSGSGARAGARPPLRQRRRQGRGQRPRRPWPRRRPRRCAATGGEAIASNHDITDWDGGRALIEAARQRLRAPRRAGQQRRHPARPDARRQHVRGGVGRRHRRAPQGPLRAHPLRGRPLAGAGQGGRGGPGRRSSTRRRRRACSATPARPTTAPPRRASGPSASSAPRSWRATACAPTASPRRPAPGSPRRPPASARWSPRPTEGFDVWDPANVSPLVAYLASADCDDHRPHVLRAGRHGPA